ncbi:MAG TPA: hypothetical protein VGI16_00540 [Candidatus Acidoferrum sp.]|jgi:hypothetical protein
MSAVNPSQANGGTVDLPPFSLDVQALDLGEGIKSVGMELLGTESREPVRGAEAAEIWAAALQGLCGNEPFVLDFFSHIERVTAFCEMQEIAFREATGRCIVLTQPDEQQVRKLFERFEAETFGMRAGAAAQNPDSDLEEALSHRGLDAYQAAYARYTFCAVCEPEDGWITVLSNTLWTSEVIRRVRPAVQAFDIHIARPQ